MQIYREWHTFLIVVIKVVHRDSIWLSLITEQNLIILGTCSGFSGESNWRKEIFGIHECCLSASDLFLQMYFDRIDF